MSVFKVKLQNTDQGLLDINPLTGLPFVTSVQRTVYVAGPGRTYRAMADGTTFTDCNYWMRFVYPNVPLNQAFISVVTDDGSIFSDIEGENTYALIFGGNSAYNVLSTDAFTTNLIDILGTYGSYATFVQITNNGTVANQDIKVQLNGSTNAIMSLAHGVTQVFNAGDLLVSKIAFQGGVSNTTVQVVLSVRSICYS